LAARRIFHTVGPSGAAPCGTSGARLHQGHLLAGRNPRPMRAVLDVVFIAINVYTWVIIAAAIFSWLYAFNVVNPRNQFVASIGQFLYAVTEPALRLVRRFIPSFGGIDISPIILILGLYLIRQILYRYVYFNVF
jgi:YggT family protein